MSIPDAWRGILDEGETILWQGKPASGIQLEWDNAFKPLFFTFYTGFSVFWMILASQAGGIFWMFGLLFFVVGLYGLVGVHFYKAFLRAHTYYTLTNKRAFIAHNVFGKRTLDSYPITAATRLKFEERGPYASILFASRSKRHKRGSSEHPVGFERLSNGRDVYTHFRALQEQS